MGDHSAAAGLEVVGLEEEGLEEEGSSVGLAGAVVAKAVDVQAEEVSLVALVTAVVAVELASATVEEKGWECICHQQSFACTQCSRCTP